MTAFPAHMHPKEASIINAVITKALSKGYKISVTDGEEKVLVRSADRAAIQAATCQTDETMFWIYQGDVRLGSIWFVHGNGEDVVADHTDRPLIEELVA